MILNGVATNTKLYRTMIRSARELVPPVYSLSLSARSKRSIVTKKQHTYTVAVKLGPLDLIEDVQVEAAAAQLGFPCSTLHSWWTSRDKLVAF
ncbi:hypothetical protein PybrP1_011034 [[Pythium] brassicae (nom. inval.)]|nr:hypothetical protein PybrP1_011034 [[Pythium] brassicae (nom. inval.)]